MRNGPELFTTSHSFGRQRSISATASRGVEQAGLRIEAGIVDRRVRNLIGERGTAPAGDGPASGRAAMMAVSAVFASARRDIPAI